MAKPVRKNFVLRHGNRVTKKALEIFAISKALD